MRDKPKVFSGTTPWTRIEDIEGRYINTSLSGQFVSDETIKSMNLKVIPKGSLIVSASATFGVVAIVNNDLITNQTFIGLVPNKDFDIDFLYSLFEAPTTKGKLLKLSAGSTIFYIARESFENLVLSVPSKEEQIKISKVFKSIDDSITLHQRKLNNLKLKKKALLQKLFPKNGERYPELRFPGFTDAWEQRKLGDVAIITGGGTPSTNVPEYWNGDIDWYSPVEIGKNRYVSKSTRKITKLGLEKSSAKLLPIGTVLFTSRAGIGNTAILQAEGCTNQGFQSITPDSKELDTYFLYTMTPRLKRYGEVTGAGSTFVEVSGKQMEKMSLVLPSLEEQKQIGRFFRTIDDSITLHQRKLDHLQLQKKALLQQMFV